VLSDDIRLYNRALSECSWCQIFEDGGGCAAINSGDADQDGICDRIDNCPDDSNPGQEDADGDGIGNVCEPILEPLGVDSSVVTQVVTADLDLDTYTDVVFSGETV